MTIRQNKRRLCALLLSGVMLLTQLPVAAMAENLVPGDGRIASFAELPSGVAERAVPVGTADEALILPDTLGAEVYRVTEDTAPPVNGAPAKTVVRWEFVNGENLNGGELALPGVRMDNQADLDAVVKLLPARISAEIEGETDPQPVFITWSCPDYTRDADGNWPLTGAYLFTAALQADYACDQLPTVTVRLGGGSLFDANNTITYDGLTITATNGGSVSQAPDKQITLNASGGYEISGKWNGTLDGVAWNNEKAVITVLNGVIANVRFSDLTINVGGKEGACAFAVAAGGTANLTLAGGNTLTSGKNRAGLEVPENAAVTIDGDDGGKLTAIGGSGGAGIGSGDYGGSGSITISGGTVTANGIGGGAGIGGGYLGGSSSITISGGTVTANGSSHAGLGSAGIGGGYGGGSSSITISGGTVTANGDGGGAGVGGGIGGGGGDITINGSANVTAVGGDYDEPIPLALSGHNGIIQIGGNAVVSATGGNYNNSGLNSGGSGIGGAGTSSGIGGYGGGSGIGGGGGHSANNLVEITSGTVTATGGNDAPGIGGTFGGGTVNITGAHTAVKATAGSAKTYDVGDSANSDGNLSVTGGAMLEMTSTGTNAASLDYQNCIIIGQDGIPVHYDGSGAKIAETPQIASHPQSQTVQTGGAVTLSVDASVADGGSLSYQWYRNTANSGTGGTELPGEASASCAVPTGAAGTIYYYVVVTNTNHHTTAAVTSSVAAVTVTSGSSSGGGGGSSGGGSVSAALKDSYTATGDTISQTISRSGLKKLADTGKSLTLSCGKAGMTFAPAALNVILAAVPAGSGSIAFAAAPADLSAFPDAAALFGGRPVYAFTVGHRDASGAVVTAAVDFPAGSAAITLNYTPAAGEVTENLSMVHVDGTGAVTWLDPSSYDSGKVLAEVPHFSIYGVARKTPAPVFTDIEGHWAEEDIEFAAARGLLNGTGGNAFSPDGSMTRAMFVTALYRLAGNPQGDGEGGAFTDVPAGAYYAGAVRWAAEQGIVNGTGEKTFSPDTPITREQMAVIMQRYAQRLGYALPVAREAVTFTDDSRITGSMKDAVRAIQQAGIMNGRGNNRFGPKDAATRAEVSAVLHRYVELVIDPAEKETAPNGAD